jgi:hypothetical protein
VVGCGYGGRGSRARVGGPSKRKLLEEKRGEPRGAHAIRDALRARKARGRGSNEISRPNK